jgi:DNA polymerase delta subunit 1
MSLRVFAVDWSGRDDGGQYKIRLFGKDPAGRLVCAFIRWFPYFFVPLDAAWPAGRQSSFVTELVEKHGAVARLSKVVSRKTLWGFTGNEARPFAQLAFPTLAAARRARKRFKKTYEASVDPIVRFFHVRRVPPSGWVCISSFAEVCEGGKQTVADLEIETTYTSVGPAVDCAGPDAGPDAQIQVPPLIFASWDIECFSGSGKFPMSSNPEDKIIQISTTFWRYGEADPYRTAVACLLETAAVGGVDISWFAEEHEVIDAWIELLRAEKADVLLGWNTDQFDWKYVSGRADVLVDDFSGEPLVHLSKLGRLRVPDGDDGDGDDDDDDDDGNDYSPWNDKERGGTSRIFELNSGAYGNNAFHVLTTPGCVQLDLMQYFRKEFKLDSYALNAVSQKYLGECKLDLPAGQIFSKFGGTPADRADIAAYAAQDTLLPLKLLRKMAVFENISEMANAVSVPVSFILTRGQQVRVFSVILQKARSKGFVCPDDVAISVEGKYAGATVLDAQRGAYFDVVSGLDFASLYPSIMRAYSLCPSTIVLDARYAALEGVDYYEIDTGLGVYRCARAGSEGSG